MDYLRVKLLFPDFMLEVRGLVKLGRFSGEYLDISSWWSSLHVKLSVSVIMRLVEDMATDAKRASRPNTLGLTSLLLSLS